MTVHRSKFVLKMLACVCVALSSAAFNLAAQERSEYGSVPRQKTLQSQAEMEADQLVSLSADKIIQLLRDEPGLLLQVKKRLVRRAYDQGRLLDPVDLNDEALFRLLREDDNVRILATQEIEDRAYIRPKPSKEELAQEAYRQMQRLPLRTQQDENQSPVSTPDLRTTAQSQEEKYWSRRDDQRTPSEQNSLPYSLPPDFSPYPPDAPQAQPRNPARELNRTQMEAPPDSTDNPFDPLITDSGQMPRVRPDELPGLLRASVSENPMAPPVGDVPRSLLDRGASSQPRTQQPDSRSNSAPVGEGFARRASPEPRDRMTEPIPDLNQSRTVIRHRPNPYANVPSLYDLYSQVSRRSPVLERFGADVFRTGMGNMDDLPMDLPVGPDYVLGPGDGLNIELWGSIAQRLQRVVDRTGQVALPEAGPVLVSGHTLGDVQRVMQGVMRSQYRDVEVDVSLARLRTVRVYVVGDVQSPGAYDISSLSTPLNALYAGGGPTAGGSLRTLQHYRGKQLVQEIDIYDLLLRGVSGDLQRIQPGDIIKVPPIGPQVTVEGMVRRPAIYELDGKANLAEVLELAGGVLPSGALRHIDVERVVAHESRTMLRLDLPEGNDPQSGGQGPRGFQCAGRRQDQNLSHPFLQREDHLSRRPCFPSRQVSLQGRDDGHRPHPLL